MQCGTAALTEGNDKQVNLGFYLDNQDSQPRSVLNVPSHGRTLEIRVDGHIYPSKVLLPSLLCKKTNEKLVSLKNL